MDLCTGTGCIALLLYALLRPFVPDLRVHGVDISPRAVRLAWENARHNDLLLPGPVTPSPPSDPPLSFSQGDIFSASLLDDLASSAPADNSSSSSNSTLDVLVCNPPYVSRRGFARQTARSVRHWEPVLAQVPPAQVPAYPGGGSHDEPEDVFYARLLDVGARLRPAVMLFEVGDLAQALRVVGMALRHAGLASAPAGQVEVEVWRDWPDAAPAEDEETTVMVSLRDGSEHREVRIRGSGHGRSVFIRCR